MSACAAPSARWRPPPRRPGQRLVGELQVQQLQPLDLVAQPGRRLEFHVAGSVAHAGFQVAEGGLEVVAEEGFGVLGDAGVDADVVALVGAGQDALDPGFDALTRLAVGWFRPLCSSRRQMASPLGPNTASVEISARD